MKQFFSEGSSVEKMNSNYEQHCSLALKISLSLKRVILSFYHHLEQRMTVILSDLRLTVKNIIINVSVNK